MSAGGTDLIEDTKIWQGFLRKIRQNTKAMNWTDPEFQHHAEFLYSFYRSASARQLVDARRTLVTYLELVRSDWGLGAVETATIELAKRGAPPSTLAIAAQTSARAGRDFGLSVSLVKHIAQEFPEDPFAALTLGQSYAALGKWESLDNTALTALARGAVSEWTADRWARLLLDSCRFSSVGDFLGFLPADSAARRLKELRLASFGGRTERFPYTTYLINLDRESRKWFLSSQTMEVGGYQPQRVSAVDGRQLPGYAHERLGATPRVYRDNGAGAIATALSHIRVWESFLASQESHCLVVEDDAAPYVHWTFHQSKIERLAKSDLVWGNERMSLALGEERLPADSVLNSWETVGARTPKFASVGTGTDCYLVSRSGAEKLLELYKIHSIQGHIDGQMAAYGLPDSAFAPENRAQELILGLRKRMAIEKGIDSVCLAIPAVTANDHGVSNTVEISREQRLAKLN